MCASGDRTLAKVSEPLGDDEIHVWWLAYQRERGRAPLRRVLSAYLGEPAETLVLHEGPYGRPALAAPHHELAFNWSHSGHRAALAVARGIAPGIDVERLRPRPRGLEIAQRFFYAPESEALGRLEPSRRDEAFLSLWTAKEAVLKALGRGLAFGLDRLQFSVPPEPVRLLRLEGDDAAAWQVETLSLDPTHIATLAWRGPPRRIRLMTLAETA